MAASARSILVKFLGDEKDLSAASKRASASVGEVGQTADNSAERLTKFGAKAIAGATVAGVGLYKMAGLASDLNETMSKTSVIFGDSSKALDKWSTGAAKSMGLSKQAALDAASTFGVFGKSAQLTGDDLANFAMDLTKLSGDLASFHNTSPEDAIEALGAALRGESEPIRRYGVLLDEATLKNRALQMGLIESTTGTLPPAIKVQAAYKEILAQTTDAQGDFARTSDGLANQTRILKADMQNLATNVGAGLLPMLKGLVGGADKLATSFTNLDPATQQTIGQIAAITVGATGAIGALSGVVGVAAKMKDRFTDANGALNFAGKAATGLGIAAIAVAGYLALMSLEADKAIITAKDFGVTMEASIVGKLRDVKTAFDDANYAFKENAELLESNAVLAEARAVESWKALQDATEKVEQVTKDFNKILEENPEYAQAFIDKAKEAGFETSEWQKRLDDTVKTMADHRTAQANLQKAVEEASGATKDQAKIEKEAKEATKAATDAWKEHVDAIKAAIAAKKEQIDQVRAETDTAFAYTRSIRDTNDSLRDLTAKTKEATDAKGKDAEKNDAAAQSLDDFAASLLDQAEAYAKSTGAVEGSTQSVDAQIKKLLELKAQYGEKVPQINGFLDAYISKLREAAAASTAVQVIGYERNVSIGGGQQVRARGGRVTAGVPYLVGEDGPEPFIPDRSGTIVPNDVYRSSMAQGGTGALAIGGGGGPSVVVHVYGSVQTERDLVDAIRGALIDIDRYTAGQTLTTTSIG